MVPGPAVDIAAFSTVVRPFSPEAHLHYSEDDISHLAEAVERTLDFGKNEVARMVEGRDVAKLRRWVGGLGWLEGDR